MPPIVRPHARRLAARASAFALAFAGATATPAAPLRAQTRADSAAIRRAVLDYVEGFYEGDTTKLVRSVRPEVAKSGFSRPRGATTYRAMTMSWPAGFMGYANRVRRGEAPTPPNAPKTIVLLDVLDQTAAKLTAWWGVDYLLLARFGERWMVTHVLWQSPPRE